VRGAARKGSPYRDHLSKFASRWKARRSIGPLQIGGTWFDAAVVSTEAGYTYRIGQTVMRFAGESPAWRKGVRRTKRRVKAKSGGVCLERSEEMKKSACFQTFASFLPNALSIAGQITGQPP
jgi:hypothetical protein